MAGPVIFGLIGVCIGALGARLPELRRRPRADRVELSEREARYRVLFEGAAEGFALLKGIWGADGRLLDYIVEDANPALHGMFQDVRMIGRRRTEFGVAHPELLEACERAFRGSPVRLELLSIHAQRWFDVRMSRVAENKVAQIVVDITERKAAENRQAEMFDELNHRVKNNLAAVSAMLNMQARAADDRQVRDQLQKAVDRIQAIGDVHASLYRASSTDEVDFAAYLERLCERLSTSLVDGERVRLEVEADPMMAPLDEAVALGLIVNELVTNAAKYAYPAPTSGVIKVVLHNRPGELMLKVSDQGQGLTHATNGDGIGMRLVRSLVQQCRGELEVEQGVGLSVIVKLQER